MLQPFLLEHQIKNRQRWIIQPTVFQSFTQGKESGGYRPLTLPLAKKVSQSNTRICTTAPKLAMGERYHLLEN
ncbi:MAG: hypothetical protein M9888_07820 [Chitinophagales bacterium]|nr:hypothetical protein [Chitinophagales bacterium]